MKSTRIAAPVLLLALSAPHALAGDKTPDGFSKLYRAAAVRDGTAPAATSGSKAGPTQPATAAPSPVRAIMRVERLPDGTLGVVCDTEAAPRIPMSPIHDHGNARDRK